MLTMLLEDFCQQKFTNILRNAIISRTYRLLWISPQSCIQEFWIQHVFTWAAWLQKARWCHIYHRWRTISTCTFGIHFIRLGACYEGRRHNFSIAEYRQLDVEYQYMEFSGLTEVLQQLEQDLREKKVQESAMWHSRNNWHMQTFYGQLFCG